MPLPGDDPAGDSQLSMGDDGPGHSRLSIGEDHGMAGGGLGEAATNGIIIKQEVATGDEAGWSHYVLNIFVFNGFILTIVTFHLLYLKYFLCLLPIFVETSFCGQDFKWIMKLTQVGHQGRLSIFHGH